jgi:hypothetical protein
MRDYLINATIVYTIVKMLFSLVITPMAVSACEQKGGVMVESRFGSQCVDRDFKVIHY